MSNQKFSKKEEMILNNYLKARQLAEQLNKFIDECKNHELNFEPFIVEGKVIISNKTEIE